MSMEIKIRVKDNVVVLDIAGVIDVNSANLVEIIGQCLRDGYSDMLLNFEDVNTIDYMGVSVIAIAFKEVDNNQGRMKFVNVPAHLKNLLSITGLDRAIEIFGTEDQAVASFREDKAFEEIKKMNLRRRFKRLPLGLKASLKNKSGRSPVGYGVEILNLSGVGAYLFGCNKFKLQDDVVLTFKVPPKDEELELEAKVVWLCDKQIQPHLYPGMGIAFYDISPDRQAKLIEFIDRNFSMLSPDE